MRKILFNIITVVGAIIAVVTGAYTIYHEAFENKNPILNITIDNAEQATHVSKVVGLEANYKFKKRKIKDLWIVDVSIENTSNATIIGKGDKKNIINDSLSLLLVHPYRLLDGVFTESDFNDVTFRSVVDTVINFRFTQWRPKEKIKLRFFIEGDTSVNSSPTFYMNDRQIIDGKISYDKQEKHEYKGFLPSRIKNDSALFALGVTAAFVFVEGIAICILLFAEYFFRLLKYRSWKEKYYDEYKSKVKSLAEEKVLNKEYAPYALPDEFWPRIEGVPKPEKVARDKGIYPDIILGSIVCAAALIGLLWILPAEWFS